MTSVSGDGASNLLIFTSSVSSGVIVGALTIIGLVAALALFLFVIGGIYFFTKARRVRITVTIKQMPE